MISISECVKNKDCSYFCGPYEFTTGKNFPNDCPAKKGEAKMTIQIIELDNIDTVKKHSNLWDTAPAWLQRTFGNNINHIYQGIDCGTVELINGDAVDYWRNNDGIFVFNKAV